MGMIFGLIFIIVLFSVNKIGVEKRLDNYDISKVDTTKLTSDMANGVSVGERRRRCVNGYYDKK